MENMNPESLLRKAQALGEDIKEMESIDVMGAYQQAQTQIKTNRRRSMYNQLMRYAAFLTIPLLLSSLILGYLYWGATDTEEKYAEVMAATGSVIRYELPDHSVVWLNSGSTLRYPTVFKKDNRNVELKGEAYFEVESDKEHPFIVKTKQLTVEATGTAFNVNAYAPDHVAAVTLVKGKVAVTLDQKKTISLSPGEKIDYNLATSLYNVNKTNTYKWCSWKDGILIFRDDPLEYVFKRLGQTYNVEFILKDAELGKYSYKATFEGESLNEILHLLEMSAPIRCKEVSNRNTNNEKFEKQRIEVSRTIQ